MWSTPLGITVAAGQPISSRMNSLIATTSSTLA